MAFERELSAALEAARLAGEYLLGEYRRFQVIPNAPASITTDADRRSQEIILSRLSKHFPGDAFIGEEQTAGLSNVEHSGSRLWIIDPIDGTRGFARKNGEFSIMIGLVCDGAIAVGVVQEPAKQRITYAAQGQGCWKMQGDGEASEPCKVRSTKSLDYSTLTQSRSKSEEEPSEPVRLIQPHSVIETYSAGVKLALVARGEADLYVNTYQAFRDWDICAGQILVEEAGGRVTGLHGESIEYGLPGSMQKAGLLASNGILHEPALEKLKNLQL